MYSQRPQLPFPIDSPDQSTMIDGLPNGLQARHLPPGLPREMEQFFGMIDGYTRLTLQDTAHNNVLRTFMYNEMSSNYFNNAAYDDLLLVVSLYSLYLLTNYNTVPPEELVAEAAVTLCSCLASINTQKYPELMGYVDPNIRQDISVQINKFNDITNMISASGRQQTPQPQIGYQPQPQGGYRQPQNYAQNRPINNGQRRDYRQAAPATQASPWQSPPNVSPQGGQTPWATTRTYGNAHNTNTSSRKLGKVHAKLPTPTTNEFDTGSPEPLAPVVQRTAQKPLQKYGFPESTLAKPKGPVSDFADVSQVSVNNDTLEQLRPIAIDSTQRKFAIDKYPNGLPKGTISTIYDDCDVLAYPAELSGLTRTPTDSQTHDLVYNTKTQRKYHVIDNEGNVIDIVRGDIMKEEDHELTPPSNNKWVGRKIYESVELAMRKSDKPLVIESKDVVFLDDYIRASNGDEAKLIAYTKLIDAKRFNVDAVNIYSYSKLIPIVFAPTDDIEEFILLQAGMSKTTTISELVEALRICSMPESLRKRIDGMCAEYINDSLEGSLNVPWKITSILDDYNELLDGVEESYSQEFREALVKGLDNSIQEMCNVLDRDAIDENFGGTKRDITTVTNIAELDDAIIESTKDVDVPIEIDTETDEVVTKLTMVGFEECTHVAQLPWTFEEMNFSDIKDDVVSMLESTHPELYSIIEAMFAYTEDMTIRSYRVVTSDDITLTIHRGWLNDTSFNLHLV